MRKSYTHNFGLDFVASHLYGSEGPFWTNDLSAEKLISMIKIIHTLSAKDWKKLLANFNIPAVMNFSKDNEMAKEIIKKILQ